MVTAALGRSRRGAGSAGEGIAEGRGGRSCSQRLIEKGLLLPSGCSLLQRDASALANWGGRRGVVVRVITNREIPASQGNAAAGSSGDRAARTKAGVVTSNRGSLGWSN